MKIFQLQSRLIFLPSHTRHITKVVAGECFRDITEMVGQTSGVVVEIDEHETVPGLESDRGQSMLAQLEVQRFIHTSRAPLELAVVIESPAVIGTDHGAAMTFALENPGAAMSAGINERVDLTLTANER